MPVFRRQRVANKALAAETVLKPQVVIFFLHFFLLYKLNKQHKHRYFASFKDAGQLLFFKTSDKSKLAISPPLPVSLG